MNIQSYSRCAMKITERTLAFKLPAFMETMRIVISLCVARHWFCVYVNGVDAHTVQMYFSK